MKVSIIIPIYNTGEYLRACIDSVCHQTYGNLQIIMINDGSNRETADICDEIAVSDSRIELVHKPNEGVSKARNTGLSMAVGDVVCFVDSDDTIHPNMVETLVDAMEREGSDIAMCDAVTITPGQPDQPDTIPDFNSSTLILQEDIYPSMLTRLAGSAWRCAYRRTSTLVATGAHFPKEIKFSEDRIFNIMAMSGARKISYIKTPFYNRLIRKGSACFRYYPDIVEQIEQMRNVLLKEVRNCWGEEYLSVYECQIAGQIRYSVTNFTAADNGENIATVFRNLRNLCANQSIKDCLINSGSEDIRSKMILYNNVISLYILGKATNLYHRLCKRGQYQQ